MPKSGHDLLMAVVRCFLNLPYVVNVALILVLFDTSYYRARSSAAEQSNIHSLVDQLVVTPLNFLLYNKNRLDLKFYTPMCEIGLKLSALVSLSVMFSLIAVRI